MVSGNLEAVEKIFRKLEAFVFENGFMKAMLSGQWDVLGIMNRKNGICAMNLGKK